MAFASSGEMDWTALDSVGWFYYETDEAIIITVSDLIPGGYKCGSGDEMLPGVPHPKMFPCSMEVIREDSISCLYAKAL